MDFVLFIVQQNWAQDNPAEVRGAGRRCMFSGLRCPELVQKRSARSGALQVVVVRNLEHSQAGSFVIVLLEIAAIE